MVVTLQHRRILKVAAVLMLLLHRTKGRGGDHAAAPTDTKGRGGVNTATCCVHGGENEFAKQ